MNDNTPFEQRILELVKKKQTVVLTEDLFDFEGFDKNEFNLIEKTLKKLVVKGDIKNGSKANNFTIFSR